MTNKELEERLKVMDSALWNHRARLAALEAVADKVEPVCQTVVPTNYQASTDTTKEGTEGEPEEEPGRPITSTRFACSCGYAFDLVYNTTNRFPLECPRCASKQFRILFQRCAIRTLQNDREKQ